MKRKKPQNILWTMLVDKQFFQIFTYWFFSNLSFFERDPHIDSPEGIRVKCFASKVPFRGGHISPLGAYRVGVRLHNNNII